MSTKHIKLTVGADVEATAENFRRDLKQALAMADADPLKVKIDVDPSSLTNVTSKIQNALGNINLASNGANLGAQLTAQVGQAASSFDQIGVAATNNANIVKSAVDQMLSSLGRINTPMLSATQQQLALPATSSQLQLSQYSSAAMSGITLPDFSALISGAESYDSYVRRIIGDFLTLSNTMKALPAANVFKALPEAGKGSLGIQSLISGIDTFINKMQAAKSAYNEWLSGMLSRSNQLLLPQFSTASMPVVENLGASAENIEHVAANINDVSSSADVASNKINTLIKNINNMNTGRLNPDLLTGNFDTSKLENYKAKYEDLRATLNSINVENGRATWKTTGIELEESAIDDLNNKMRELLQARRDLGASGGQSIANPKDIAAIQQEKEAIASLVAEIQRYTVDNKNLMSSGQYQAFQQLATGVQAGTVSLHEARVAFARLRSEVDASTTVVTKFISQLRTSIISRLSTSAISASFIALRKAVHEVYQDVVNLDKAITNLQIATGGTRQATADLVKEYSKLGNELGATTTEVADAANEWLRQGYSAEQATDLIKNSMMLSKLGMIDASEATTALTSAIHGYGLSASDAMSIVDKLTAVDMEAAASAGGLAVAMSRTATGANTAGISMDTLIGYIAKVKEVTQDSDEAVGTFFKTMVARMGNIKSGYLFDPETDEDLSDVESVLSGIGIKLRDTVGEFRSLEDVLYEVGTKWNSYGSVQQRAIAKAFAGTRQQEKFLVLMENYGDAMDLAEVSAQSAGTALEKYNDAYLKSFEASKNSLKASTESLSQSILDTDLIIGATDALNVFVKALTGINNFKPMGVNVAGIFTALSAGLVTTAVRAKSLATSFASTQAAIAPVLGELGGLTVGTEAYNASVDKLILALTGKNQAVQQAAIEEIGLVNATAANTVQNGLNAKSQDLVTAAIIKTQAARVLEEAALSTETTMKGVEISLIDATVAARAGEIVSANAVAIATGKMTAEELLNVLAKDEVTAASAKQIVALLAQTGALKVTKGATEQLTKAQLALKAVGGPVTLVIAGIVLVVYGLVKAFNYLGDSTERTREELKTYQDNLQDTENEIDTLNKKLSENRERLAELQSLKSPEVVEQEEITKLQTENAELERNIALLEARAKFDEEKISQDQKRLWKQSTGKGQRGLDAAFSQYTENLWYTDASGRAPSGFWRFLNPAITQDDFTAPIDEAVPMYIAEYNKAKAEFERAQSEALRDGIIDDDEQDSIDRYEDRLLELKGYLFDMGTDLKDMGPDAEPFLNLITTALSDSVQQAVLLKDTLENIFPSNDTLEVTFEGDVEPTEIGLDVVKNYLDSHKQSMTAEDYEEFVGSDEVVQSIASKIKDAAKNNDLLKASIVGLSDVQIVEWFINYKTALNEAEEAAKKAAEETRGFANSIAQLDSGSNALKAVGKAFNDMHDDSKVSFDTIADISKELAALKVDDSKIEQWVNTLMTAKRGSKDFTQALSDITYEIARQKIESAGLENVTEDMLASWLESQGVANATTVAQQALAEAEAKAAAEAALGKGDINGFTAALETEAGQSALTRKSFIDLIAEMIVFNNTGLDVSQKIAALKALMIQAGFTESAISGVIGSPVADYGPMSQEEYLRSIYDRFSEESEKITDENVARYKYTGSGGGSGGSGGKGKSALEKYSKSVEVEQKKLELQYKRGEISAREYFKRMEEIYADGYADLERRIANGEFSDSEADEILDEEIGMLDKLQEAHNNAYNEEKRQLDHHLKMNHITEEQYFAELTRMYLQYYAGRAEYSEEAQEAEEELYEKGTAIVEKWAGAAVDAVNAVSDAMQSMASAATDLLQGLIDANEHSFDRYYKNLQHELKMNYITEQQYTDRLDALYKKYFRDRYIYLDQYQQYEEEVYRAEQQALQDAASATEDIHGQVVDMIRDELEEQKDAIDETKQAYLDLIDIRRQALNDQKDEEDYEKEHAEKLAAVAELQRQLNALANDQSAEGVKKYKETLNSLHDAQEDLYDFEREHAYDSLEKQLDEQEEALENSASTRTEEIDKLLEDNEWLVAEAWRRMEGMTSELYDQLMAHHRKYSTAIKDDITEAWNTARDAMQRYYDGVNAHGGYDYINGRIGESGMSEAEAMEYNNTVALKNVAEYTSVFVKAIAEFASAGASLVSSFASILNTVFPNPLTSLIATGASGMASAVSGMGGVATNIFGFLGGLAGGSNFAPETGVYRTDEFGEELKLLKNTADGNYTLLTKGSKVFNARNTERLAKILEHPELLSGGLTPGVLSDIVTSIPSSAQVETNTQNINYSQSFNITGNNPTEIANEIKGVIADYTLDVIRRNARTAGRTRSVSSVY